MTVQSKFLGFLIMGLLMAGSIEFVAASTPQKSSMSEDEKISKIIQMVRQGEFVSFYSIGLSPEEVSALAVKILAMKDPRMDQNFADLSEDALRSISPDSIDDTSFKEELLYFIRDNFKPDNPSLVGLFTAFWKEPNEWTRMRIVRAAVKIGGRQTEEFCAVVLAKEGNLHTKAASIARDGLGDSRKSADLPAQAAFEKSPKPGMNLSNELHFKFNPKTPFLLHGRPLSLLRRKLCLPLPSTARTPPRVSNLKIFPRKFYGAPG